MTLFKRTKCTQVPRSLYDTHIDSRRECGPPFDVPARLARGPGRAYDRTDLSVGGGRDDVLVDLTKETLCLLSCGVGMP